MEFGNIEHVTKPVSRLVHGAIMLRVEEQDHWFTVLDAIYETGCRAWDSAHNYSGGDSERVLGAWMDARRNRDEIVILTKGCHHTADRRRVTPYDISTDLHTSFARLKTDFIDIYVLHRDDPEVPVGPIVEELNKYHEAGRIGAFGGSNWKPHRIAEANEYAEKHGLKPFTVSSPNFSLAEQFDEPWPDCFTISGPQNADDRAWYVGQNMPLFTWSSLAQGFFSGRITRANWESVKDDFPEPVSRCYAHEANFERMDRVEELAREKDMTVPQIALAYTIQNPGLDVYALIGTFTGEEFTENLKALEVKLT
ncbi:MAG: aldo/keto reductase, partial [Candidatus Latescibacterota bacterium]|nr:aldo/keto reductase [Candidatus Latescibacterota bacterium]